MLWFIPNAACGLTRLGKLRLIYIRLLNNSLGLRRQLQWGLSLTFFDSDWFGYWEAWLQCTLQTWGIMFLVITIAVSLIHCISQNPNANSQLLITKKITSLRLECQKKSEENDQLKECEPYVMTYEYHTDSKKKKTKT